MTGPTTSRDRAMNRDRAANGNPATIRIAVSQPFVEQGAEGSRKLADADRTIRQAGADGARLVLFPEGYPGPLRADERYDATEAILRAAQESGCAVCWSRIERGADRRWRKVAYVHDRDGSRLLRYERGHPATGDVHPTLSGVHLAPGTAPATFQLDGVPIGVLICSELWLPEVARLLSLAGAEVLLAPAGGGFHEVAPNWQLIARARAIENQCHVALTQHLFGAERGSALLAGPEAVVGERADAGLLIADLDLARVRWLRANDDSMVKPKPFRSLPGLLRARRPELYAALCEPVDGLYDYDACGRAS